MTSEFNGYSAREHFWGHSFTAGHPTATWSYKEEDEDSDFLHHTLYLKQLTLGPEVGPGEVHMIQVETTDFEGKEKKLVIGHLSASTSPNVPLDLSFDHTVSCTFRLIQGKGPVDLSATHLIEFPEEVPKAEDWSDSGEEEEDDEEPEAEVEDEPPAKNGKVAKRKASNGLIGKKAKKGKSEKSADDEDEDDEDDESESDDDNDDDDDEDMDDDDDASASLESSPEIKKKGSKKAQPVKKGEPIKKAAAKKAASAVATGATKSQKGKRIKK